MLGYECNHAKNILEGRFTTNSVAVAASEILLSLICLSLEDSGQSMLISPSHVVAICIGFLQQQSSCEHVIYLTIRTICRDHRSAFFNIVQTYPELLSALAEVLRTIDLGTTTKRSILTFLQDILQSHPSLTTVIARQAGVVEAVTFVASTQESWEGDISPDANKIAVHLLFILSTDVCNRRILARQARVLSSMIRFVRDHVAFSGEDVNADESLSMPAVNHREEMKQRILQLAAVL